MGREPPAPTLPPPCSPRGPEWEAGSRADRETGGGRRRRSWRGLSGWEKDLVPGSAAKPTRDVPRSWGRRSGRRAGRGGQVEEGERLGLGRSRVGSGRLPVSEAQPASAAPVTASPSPPRHLPRQDHPWRRRCHPRPDLFLSNPPPIPDLRPPARPPLLPSPPSPPGAGTPKVGWSGSRSSGSPLERCSGHRGIEGRGETGHKFSGFLFHSLQSFPRLRPNAFCKIIGAALVLLFDLE